MASAVAVTSIPALMPNVSDRRFSSSLQVSFYVTFYRHTQASLHSCIFEPSQRTRLAAFRAAAVTIDASSLRTWAMPEAMDDRRLA